MMDHTSRILIETIIKKTLKEIQDSPERSVRNLVDMALHFSNGEFQKRFFEIAQTMLKNENSPYYDLIRDTVLHVDSQRLLQFGMNLGYNGCTLGAKKIRKIEKQEGFHVPWTILLDVSDLKINELQGTYERLMDQGEEMGIYTWILYSDGDYEDILPLVENHSESAFGILCKSEKMTMEFVERASELYNLMSIIRYDDTAADICALLRKRGLLYSVYRIYDQNNVGEILDGDLFFSTEQLHPIFTVLSPSPCCPDSVSKKVYDRILQMRNQQLFGTIPWEIVYDTQTVDRIISQDSCLAAFDRAGYLRLPPNHRLQPQMNLFHTTLPQVFRYAFPKMTGDSIAADPYYGRPPLPHSEPLFSE